MVEAEPVIRAVLPDANVPTSIRSTGRAGRRTARWRELDAIIDELAGRRTPRESPASSVDAGVSAATPRVRSLTPELAKGLEFDLVVLVDPEQFGTGIEGAVDRYVAMTRATQQLVILESSAMIG